MLTFKLSKAEASAKDATESAAKCRERETEIKSKLDEAQGELIQVRDELRQNVTELKVRTYIDFIFYFVLFIQSIFVVPHQDIP